MGISKNNNEIQNFSDIVFVIGAGAHVPYGFPTSKGLTEKINKLALVIGDPYNLGYMRYPSDPEKQKLQSYKTELCIFMKNLNIIENENNDIDYLNKGLDNFIKKFKASGAPSIDESLELHLNENDEKFKKIGKLVLSYLIFQSEKDSPIEHKSEWIHDIFIQKFMKTENMVDLFLKNPPKIFTFNYDNFFDKIILERIKYITKKNHKYALDETEKIITHIYGHINTRIYEEKEIKNLELLFTNSLNSLKIIPEDRNNDDLSEKIGKAIYNAKKVYFLGFGFDEENTTKVFKNIYNDSHREFLGSENELKFQTNKSICSTNFGLTINKINQLSSEIKNKYNINIDLNPKFIEEKDYIKTGIVNCLKLFEDIKPICKII